MEASSDVLNESDKLCEQSFRNEGSEKHVVSPPAHLTEECSGVEPCALAFDQFILACKPYLKLPGDEPIIEKLKKHFKNISLDHSQELLSLLGKFSSEVVEKKSDIYVIIQDVICNFKSIRENTLSKLGQKQAHIKKLENYLGKLDKAIKKIQAKEVNLDDDKDSVYILEDRYKERFNKAYAKLCDLVGCSRSEPKAKINFNGTRFPEINRNVSKYLRKSDEFPDYSTILNIIEKTNENEGLHMTEESVSKMARDVFEAVGSKLKKRRIADFSYTIGCYLTDTVDSDDGNDPATIDPVLREKLDANQVIAKKRIDEVFEKFSAEQDAGQEDAFSENSESENDSSSDDEIQLIESENSTVSYEELKISNNAKKRKIIAEPVLDDDVIVLSD